jgi:hypothetical protein
MAGKLISSAFYDSFLYFYLHFANVQGNGRMGATLISSITRLFIKLISETGTAGIKALGVGTDGGEISGSESGSRLSIIRPTILGSAILLALPKSRLGGEWLDDIHPELWPDGKTTVDDAGYRTS